MLFINSSYLFISVTKYNKTSCLDPLIQLFNTTERSARQILIQFFFFKDRWSPHYKVKILRTSLLDFPLIQQQNTCVCSYFKCSLSFNLYRTKNKIKSAARIKASQWLLTKQSFSFPGIHSLKTLSHLTGNTEVDPEIACSLLCTINLLTNNGDFKEENMSMGSQRLNSLLCRGQG